MRTTRDCEGTDASSGRLPADGSGIHLSGRFSARIRNHIGRGSSSKGDSGAAMVEMAFIFGILIMLLVGVVTSAIAFGQKNQIENAAREASRYAATLPEAWLNLDDVVDVAVLAAQGNLDPGVDGQYICVAHTGHNVRRVVDEGMVDEGPGICYPESLSDSRIQVETRRQTEINAAFFSVDVNLNAKATARYERAES